MPACPNHPSVEYLRGCGRCLVSFCPNCLVPLGESLFCGDCRREEIRDLQSGTVRGQLDLASVSRRFAARFVDGVLAAGVFGLGLGFGLARMTALSPALQHGAPPFWWGAGFLTLPYVVLGGLPFLYEGLML